MSRRPLAPRPHDSGTAIHILVAARTTTASPTAWGVGSGDPISYGFAPWSLRAARDAGVEAPDAVPLEGVLTTWLRIAPQGGYGKLEDSGVPVGRLGQRALHREGDGSTQVYGISMTSRDSLESALSGLPGPEAGALELVFTLGGDPGTASRVLQDVVRRDRSGHARARRRGDRDLPRARDALRPS